MHTINSCWKRYWQNVVLLKYNKLQLNSAFEFILHLAQKQHAVLNNSGSSGFGVTSTSTLKTPLKSFTIKDTL